jgi:hypothetical protein
MIMLRSLTVALLAGVSLAAAGLATEASARGGGHFGGGFGGHFGGGHFGGERFEGRPEFRTPEFRPEHMEEMRRPAEEHRPAEDARRGEEHRDDADRRDTAGDRRDDADRARQDGDRARDAGDRRDLASQHRDLHQPVNAGRFDHNQFWNDQFGARTFNCNGCRYGWAGAVFWPFAYGDIFSWAWWPNAGVPAFWNYGLNYILSGLFWPNGVYQWPQGYGAYAYNDDYQYAREAHQDVYSAGPAAASAGAQMQPETSSEATQTCSGFAPGVGSLPMDKIEQTLKPQASQDQAFDDLVQASSKAELILASACPNEPPLTPVSRLDALQRRLDAMTQAIGKVEGPLAAFTEVLTPEQKRELDAMGTSSGGSSMEMGDVGNCIDEGEQFTDVPAQQIEQAVQPDAGQRAKLDALKTAANQAAERLRSSCPTGVPATPEKRLAAMDQRLHATITAVSEVRPALVGFYESLSDDQKARFNTLPPEPAGK